MKVSKLKYQQQIFLWFVIIFTCFTAGIILFQQKWEHAIKTENLKKNLDNYADIIHRYIENGHLHIDVDEMSKISTLTSLFPTNLRITIINLQGDVIFDNRLTNLKEYENHISRKEIQQAAKEGTGSDIRPSTSLGYEYFYFSRQYDRYFIRVALPYNIDVQHFLNADNLFLYFTLILFLTALALLLLISWRLGKSITGLRDYINLIEKNENEKAAVIQFPNTEFGEIASRIAINYQHLKKAKNQLDLEKEKLTLCFQNSDEGIGIFSKIMEPEFINTHFVTFVNTILDEHVAVSKSLFDTETFSGIKDFLEKRTAATPLFIDKIAKNGKYFSIKCIVFHDKSFEIIINDITQTETTRLIKQEMTNNIAHELRTPVSSIRGYLETILDQENIDLQKQRSFLERSYQQTLKLSELIRDISLITKIEEAPNLFIEEPINIASVLQELNEEFETSFQANGTHFKNNVPQNIQVTGNKTLIYSIFRNLIENTVAYAGKNTDIIINLYNESEVRYFFSFSDTGKGVSEEHLSKMFERFYRIDEGRTRDSGGSGLGLAIVKNAILFHQGEIVAKNRKGGGLEFLFTLKK